MSKKIIILITSLVLVFLVILQTITFKYVRQTLYDYNTKGKNQIVHDSIKNYDLIMCNYNIFRPKYIFITSAHYQYENIDRKSLSIGFFNLSRPHIFSSNWNAQYTGGTTIENTTFPELVKMVKEDCSQFQKAKGEASDKTINWSYSPYKQEPPKESKVEYTEGMVETARQRVLDQYNRAQEFRDQSN